MAIKEAARKADPVLLEPVMEFEVTTPEEFLGDVKVWIDRFMKQGGGYPVKVLGTHQFTFGGNWKIQLENTTDGYHFPIVHKSFMSSVDAETFPR